MGLAHYTLRKSILHPFMYNMLVRVLEQIHTWIPILQINQKGKAAASSGTHAVELHLGSAHAHPWWRERTEERDSNTLGVQI